ncbi:MAG: hypothetical protein Q4C50_12265 [Eubacteriales bacterium]|nr:hypothetical protein [Eubacteriales bacterium]
MNIIMNHRRFTIERAKSEKNVNCIEGQKTTFNGQFEKKLGKRDILWA